jgi:hypothetical protein
MNKWSYFRDGGVSRKLGKTEVHEATAVWSFLKGEFESVSCVCSLGAVHVLKMTLLGC